MAETKKPRVIDLHAHINVKAAQEGLKAGQSASGKAAKGGGGGLSDSTRAPILAQIDARLACMDEMGVDMTVLTPSPPRGFYKADEATATEVARIVNDEVAKIARDHQSRIVAVGNVALQHVDSAIAELDRALAMGHKGARISTNIAGAELGERRFDPFWAHAEKTGAVIFLHPQGFTEPKRLEDYYFGNAVGNPLETTLALGQLIFGGVFERYPGLKLVAAHGGGYFPFYLGRFEQAWRTRAECRAHLGRSPAEVVRQIWFDTVLFRPDQVAFLIGVVGRDRVVMGTDTPYDMGENHPVRLIDEVPGLDPATRAAILGGNGAALLGLAQ